jgi:glucose-6-phosphate 1-dehydrogenase
MVTRITPVPAAVSIAPPAAHPAPPCAFVVFGAGGDLTRRKLVPALYNLALLGYLPQPFAAVGVARRGLNDDAFREGMRTAVAEFSRSGLGMSTWQGFAGGLHYVDGAFEDAQTFRLLARRLDELDRSLGLGGNRLFYLATPPREFPVILEQLKAAGLIAAASGRSWTRVIIEKPFGRDLESARALNELVAACLDESQTFRIDHYLGKETVQNILVFRFANSIFEPVWNRKYVDHVEITAAETVGVETRGAFYEQTGVLRDIVQNHLLQVLALVAMEPPNTGSADDVRSERLKVVRALREPTEESIARDVVLGQYRGYRQEKDVAPDSVTPTFAALRVQVDNWRWQGVPFYLRAGKRLARRATEVALHLQPIPLSLFARSDACDLIEPNVLTLRIQPDEGIELRFASKVPGHDLAIRSVLMEMSYKDAFGGEPPEAYERLLLDAMRGDATLFARRDAVEASWSWITPMLRFCDAHPPGDFPNYEPGSWGPARCDEWKRRSHGAWREP